MLKKKIMAYVNQLLDQPSQWQTSQQAGSGSVPKFTSTSITVKQLLIKNRNINQSKSSLLIWHYVSYLFLFILFSFFFFFFFFLLLSYSKIFPNVLKPNWCCGRQGVGDGQHNHLQQHWDSHRGQGVGLRVIFRRNYRHLQWKRGVSTAWTLNANCSECWNLAKIILFLMKFDEI